jgi:uncharacterized HAD superfamily protein
MFNIAQLSLDIDKNILKKKTFMASTGDGFNKIMNYARMNP